MFFLITSAVLSAICFVLIIVPPLYIFDPDRDAGESLLPPTAGEVVVGADVSNSVRQKLYLLFVIPVAVVVQTLFLYFAYYRPVRFIQYRVELNLVTLRSTLEAGLFHLQSCNILSRHPQSQGSLAASFAHSSTASPRPVGMGGRGRGFPVDGGARGPELTSNAKWEWRRHARPKSVKKDVWVNSAPFDEVRTLRRQVEKCFLTECGVAEANFIKIVTKAVGAFKPLGDSNEAITAVAMTQAKAEDFYNSTRPPLTTLGPRSSSNVRSTGDTKAPHGPRRGGSVLLMPTESAHRDRRRGSVSALIGGGNGGNGVGGSYSNLHFNAQNSSGPYTRDGGTAEGRQGPHSGLDGNGGSGSGDVTHTQLYSDPLESPESFSVSIQDREGNESREPISGETESGGFFSSWWNHRKHPDGK